MIQAKWRLDGHAKWRSDGHAKTVEMGRLKIRVTMANADDEMAKLNAEEIRWPG